MPSSASTLAPKSATVDDGSRPRTVTTSPVIFVRCTSNVSPLAEAAVAARSEGDVVTAQFIRLPWLPTGLTVLGTAGAGTAAGAEVLAEGELLEDDVEGCCNLVMKPTKVGNWPQALDG